MKTEYILVPTVFITATILAIILLRIKEGTLSNKRKKELKEVEYNRELPFGGNIYCIFYALTHSAKSPYTVNFINAVIVKWYKEKKVDIKYYKEKDVVEVHFKNGVNYEHKAEQMLYHTIMSFAGSDEVLTYNDLIASLTYNLSTYQYFMNNISTYIGDILYKYNISEERNKIAGLVKFINDFSMIPELNKDEVYLRDEYILFAILTGCSDKIKDEFDNFIPFNISKLYRYVDEINIFIDNFDARNNF